MKKKKKKNLTAFLKLIKPKCSFLKDLLAYTEHTCGHVLETPYFKTVGNSLPNHILVITLKCQNSTTSLPNQWVHISLTGVKKLAHYCTISSQNFMHVFFTFKLSELLGSKTRRSWFKPRET